MEEEASPKWDITRLSKLGKFRWKLNDEISLEQA